MTDDRHMRVMSIFLRAVDLKESERSKLLDETCSDPGLRKEVESLLKHHTAKTLIAADDFTKAQPRVSVRRETRAILRDATLGLKRRKHLLVASAAIVAILLGTACWVFLRVQASLSDSVQNQLTTVLEADVRALQMWIGVRQADVTAWAQNEALRELVLQLIAEPDAIDTEMANRKITELLESVCERAGNYGVGVIDRQGRIIATSKEAWVGQEVNKRGAPYVQRLNHGQEVFTIPTRRPRFSAGVLSTVSDPTIAVAAPVRNDAGDVIGALCFGFDADEEFTDLLAIAQLGKEGETYAFDADGLLLSNLRHRERLVAVGLLAEDQQSALNVELRDPGVNMLRGYRPTQPRALQHPTRMIKQATALEHDSSTKIAYDTEGYRNYLGVNVVGAWQWLGEDLAFGVASELPYDEAYAPLRYINRAFLFLVASVLLLTLGLVLSSVLVVRLSHRAGEAERLGAYELVELIGQGGMGRVYRARHAFLKRDAAIKLLDGFVDKETSDRFEQEAQITCQLTNPNTIQVYDYGRTDQGVFYYAMEYLQGCTLEQLVAASGVVPPKRVIFILRQLCGSLQEAHDHGLIHRDIKPANIMLCRRGGISDFVKVLDFGIAKQTSSERDLTRSDTIVGTPHYIAPERIAGGGKVDARSDLFSVGCVGFYLLTGETPFPAKRPVELFHQLLHADAPAPSSRTDAAIVPELDQVIERCLRREPAQRPQSAQEIVALMDRLSEQHPWHAEDADRWWKCFTESPPAAPAAHETQAEQPSSDITRRA